MILGTGDLSLQKTAIHIVRADQGVFDVLHEERFDCGSGCDVERFWRAAVRIRRLFREYAVEDVAFEGFAHGAKGSSILQMAGLGYIVRLAMWHHGRGYWDVAPPSLKKIVTGKGNAPKELMIREVYRRWQYEAADNNDADSYGLARGLAGHHLGHARKSDGEAWKKAVRIEGRPGGWA